MAENTEQLVIHYENIFNLPDVMIMKAFCESFYKGADGKFYMQNLIVTKYEALGKIVKSFL